MSQWILCILNAENYSPREKAENNYMFILSFNLQQAILSMFGTLDFLFFYFLFWLSSCVYKAFNLTIWEFKDMASGPLQRLYKDWSLRTIYSLSYDPEIPHLLPLELYKDYIIPLHLSV